VTFKETRADAPRAVNSLFYAGERDGYAFMYPKTKPLAEAPVFEVKPAAAAAIEERAVEDRVVAEASPAPAVITPEANEPPASEVASAPVPAPAPEPARRGSADTKELPKSGDSRRQQP
jgi:hypothetical protein